MRMSYSTTIKKDSYARIYSQCPYLYLRLPYARIHSHTGIYI